LTKKSLLSFEIRKLFYKFVFFILKQSIPMLNLSAEPLSKVIGSYPPFYANAKQYFQDQNKLSLKFNIQFCTSKNDLLQHRNLYLLL
jgi:hypothetical protein